MVAIQFSRPKAACLQQSPVNHHGSGSRLFYPTQWPGGGQTPVVQPPASLLLPLSSVPASRRRTARASPLRGMQLTSSRLPGHLPSSKSLVQSLPAPQPHAAPQISSPARSSRGGEPLSPSGQTGSFGSPARHTEVLAPPKPLSLGGGSALLSSPAPTPLPGAAPSRAPSPRPPGSPRYPRARFSPVGQRRAPAGGGRPLPIVRAALNRGDILY